VKERDKISQATSRRSIHLSQIGGNEKASVLRETNDELKLKDLQSDEMPIVSRQYNSRSVPVL